VAFTRFEGRPDRAEELTENGTEVALEGEDDNIASSPREIEETETKEIHGGWLDGDDIEGF
jgi:hypothetical protein